MRKARGRPSGPSRGTRRTHTYTVLLEVAEEGGYHAYCPVLRGCHSQGDTLEEAVANVREAIQLYIESLRAHGDPVPVEDLLIKPVEVRA